MTRRYFSNDLPIAGGLVSLSSEEASHASRVMRAKVGDSVTVFDGAGHEAVATIESLGRSECVCLTEPAIAVTRMPGTELHLGVALPKPERAKELIERLTELGVSSVTPIIADRTQRPPSPSLIGKLQRIVIESCKQCERNVLMTIQPAVAPADFFRSELTGRRVIAHQGKDCLSRSDLENEAGIVVAVGPEGGWTDEEVALAESREFSRISLGQRIYRIETAAVALAASIVT